MKKSVLFILAAALLCLASCTPGNGVNPDLQGEADVMFVGNIVTMDTENPRVEAMTVNVAWQLKEENRLGQLKSGMIANLSICDVDFLNAPIENVADAQVVATYVDGVKVFGE